MAIVIEATYSKKVRLPHYSSHQYDVTLRSEIRDLTQVEAEICRLYALLQVSVDLEIQEQGCLPQIESIILNVYINRYSYPANGVNGNGNGRSQSRD